MAKDHLGIYTDYLAVTFRQATATGLSSMLDGAIGHDSITRFLSGHEFGSKDLWHYVKSTVRQIEQDDGVLIFDDTIQEKQWTDENDIMCWHYDHSAGRSVCGINLLNCLYLACSDLNVNGKGILRIYKKRWSVEVFHKFLKQNAVLAKSPTRRVRTQSNHIFAAIVATFKLERLNIKHGLTHFALRGKLYLKAIKAAFDELQSMVTA